MKTSQVFKILALASAGAFAYSKIKENPGMFKTGPRADTLNVLFQKLQQNTNLAGFVNEKDVTPGPMRSCTAKHAGAPRGNRG
jgi:hypothetical protein